MAFGSYMQNFRKIGDKNPLDRKIFLTLILMKLIISNLYSLGILCIKFYQNHRQKFF